jgi:hypothetical protein
MFFSLAYGIAATFVAVPTGAESSVLFDEFTAHRDTACRVIPVVIGDVVDLPPLDAAVLIQMLVVRICGVREYGVEGNRSGHGGERPDRHYLLLRIDSLCLREGCGGT